MSKKLKMEKSNKIFIAVIATAFDRMSNIHICGAFQSEKDAVMAVIKKVFEMDLISRERYISFLKDDYENTEEAITEIEEIEEMTDEQFEDFVCSMVEENPTTDNLELTCDTYSDFNQEQWSVQIKIQHL